MAAKDRTNPEDEWAAIPLGGGTVNLWNNDYKMQYVPQQIWPCNVETVASFPAACCSISLGCLLIACVCRRNKAHQSSGSGYVPTISTLKKSSRFVFAGDSDNHFSTGASFVSTTRDKGGTNHAAII